MGWQVENQEKELQPEMHLFSFLMQKKLMVKNRTH